MTEQFIYVIEDLDRVMVEELCLYIMYSDKGEELKSCQNWEYE